MPTVQTISRCWLNAEVAQRMSELAATWFPLEVGGILVGHVNGSDAVIVDFIGPGPAASHEQMRFTPDHDFHRHEVARHYQESAGRRTYLGDWHTHPNGPSSLSELDQQTLRTIAKERAARCSQPLMLLLANGPEDWEITAFALRKQRWWLLRRGEPVDLVIC